VYQFTSVPYGSKTAYRQIYTGMETALVDDVVNDHAITYVDICLFIYQAYEKVLIRTRPTSDAIKGMASKFMHVCGGPYIITKLLDHSAYELRDESGKLHGRVQQKQLRLCQKADDEIQIHKCDDVVTTDARTNHRLKDKKKKMRRNH